VTVGVRHRLVGHERAGDRVVERRGGDADGAQCAAATTHNQAAARMSCCLRACAREGQQEGQDHRSQCAAAATSVDDGEIRAATSSRLRWRR
jgi:hypothetical protein